MPYAVLPHVSLAGSGLTGARALRARLAIVVDSVTNDGGLMNRIQTLLLGVIALALSSMAVTQIAPGLVSVARAQDSAVKCETWLFDLDLGKKAGAANVEAHRVDMEARISRMFGPTSHTVYSNGFPILNVVNNQVVAYSGVFCVAK